MASSWLAPRACSIPTISNEPIRLPQCPCPFPRRHAILSALSTLAPSLPANQTMAQSWSYGEDAQWGGLCFFGKEQSPVNLEFSSLKHGESLGPLVFEYGTSLPASFLTTAQGTKQVNFTDGGNKLKVGGRELRLLQFHFHTPSEHLFDGKRYAMEAHLVHLDARMKILAVVGVMLEATNGIRPNRCLSEALKNSPIQYGRKWDPYSECRGSLRCYKKNSLTPASLLPDNLKYVHYRGSLTTPPCTEGVDWFLLETPVKVSASQVFQFMQFVGDNHTIAMNIEMYLPDPAVSRSTSPEQPIAHRPENIGPEKLLCSNT